MLTIEMVFRLILVGLTDRDLFSVSRAISVSLR